MWFIAKIDVEVIFVDWMLDIVENDVMRLPDVLLTDLKLVIVPLVIETLPDVRLVIMALLIVANVENIQIIWSVVYYHSICKFALTLDRFAAEPRANVRFPTVIWAATSPELDKPEPDVLLTLIVPLIWQFPSMIISGSVKIPCMLLRLMPRLFDCIAKFQLILQIIKSVKIKAYQDS